jgi:ligand-binding sensor domain-containing protein/two-component sensor histidine kinase
LIQVRLLSNLCVGFLLSLLLAAGACYGQLPDFNVQVLDDNNGIQTANASRIIRDRQGFLWILSPRHMQRFDGQNVTRIETEGEDLLDVASDSSGSVWTVSDTGIRKYSEAHRRFQNVKTVGPRIEPLNKLYKLQITPDNRVWANAGKGVYRLDPKTGAFHFQSLPGLEGQYYYRRIFNMLGYKLFLADVHTLFSYDTRSQSVRSLPFSSVRALVPVTRDVAWVNNNLLQTFEVNFSTGKVTRITALDAAHPLGMPLAELISITSLGKHTRLVNTTKGCYLYDINARTFNKAVIFDSGKALPNEENYSDFRDRDGTQWILCQEGILFFSPQAHTIGWLNGFPGAEKGHGNNIKAIAEDNNGNVWLAGTQGVSMLNLRTGKMAPLRITRPEVSALPEVRAMIFDGQNLIIAPNRSLPAIVNPTTKAFTEITYPPGKEGRELRAKLQGDLIATLFRMQDGNFLIVGESSCYVIEKDTYRISERNFKGSEQVIQAVTQDFRGNFWMGTYQGLLVTDVNFQHTLTDNAFLPGNLVSAVLLRNDSTAWCGSVGLYEVIKKGNRLTKKLIFPELRNQRISIIHRDKCGRTWIGGDDGLYLFDENTGKLQWFDFRDNIQNKRFNYNSIMEAANGHIYLGGFNGLNYFDPEKLRHREEKLNVTISSVRINEDDSLFVENALPLSLDWKQNSVEIRFITPYFRNPQKLMYRYRLAGLDQNWVENGRNNTVRFSSLSPGSYTFSVAASIDGIAWSEASSPFSFIILTPWWRETWFIALSVLLLAVLAYWLFKRRVAVIRRQTALREHMAELEMRALRAQMNPHFIFNCLNSINRYIVKSDNATASLYLTRFAKLIRLILDNSNSKNVLLSSELEALKLYIEMERIRFDNKFDYQVIVDEDVNADSIEVPSLIIQPYVENAIWHGLLHKETSGSLFVKIRMIDEGMLECVVEDDGIGREKALEFKSKTATGKKSLGMKLTEDRIAVLNQYAKTNASVDIMDLEDSPGHASGTRVTINIPV